MKKIFQVPYRLPPVVTEQLNELLEAMYDEAELELRQREDFCDRAEPHLRYLATRGRVNPREVKRFLNTYTLQTLVRPQLKRDVVLPLQTLNFRYDWQVLYDAILIDSMLFRAALTRFRDEDDRAFEDLSPELGTVQEELAAYLRSDAVAALAGLADEDSLDPYVTSLEATGRTPPWIAAAYGEIGLLRREIRRIRRIESPTDADRDALGRIASDVASKLDSQVPTGLTGFPSALEEIRTVTEQLRPAPQSNDKSVEEASGRVIAYSLHRLDNVATRIYQALRAARSALAPAVA